MRITPKMNVYVQALLETGLYGFSAEEVLERLAAERIQELLKEKTLINLSAADPVRLPDRCPNCGSPNLNDISGMGEPEKQCLDCGNQFKP